MSPSGEIAALSLTPRMPQIDDPRAPGRAPRRAIANAPRTGATQDDFRRRRSRSGATPPRALSRVSRHRRPARAAGSRGARARAARAAAAGRRWQPTEAGRCPTIPVSPPNGRSGGKRLPQRRRETIGALVGGEAASCSGATRRAEHGAGRVKGYRARRMTCGSRAPDTDRAWQTRARPKSRRRADRAHRRARCAV